MPHQPADAGVPQLTVELRDVGKSFGGLPVLRHIDLTIRPGTVHALVGENGAGKSTLMKILGGVYRADSGEIAVEGEAVVYETPAEALDAGVVVIPQEMRVVPAQTVAENVVLGRIPVRTRFGILQEVDRAAMRRRAGELTGRLNLSIDVDIAHIET